jgi:hypothetical protein
MTNVVTYIIPQVWQAFEQQEKDLIRLGLARPREAKK